MGRKTLCALLWWMSAMGVWATHRHWVVADGLPTAEVRQIIELPNRQMLVNCEGEFCLSNGAGFNAIPCDYRHTFQLKEFAKGYGRLWQGDSLLWLHDFYRVYLFDVRTRTFRYDVAQRLDKALMRKLFEGELQRDVPDLRQWQCIDSLGLAKVYGTMTMDSQGGLWIGTRNDGIIYLSPRKEKITQLPQDHRLIGIARSYTDSKGRKHSIHDDRLFAAAAFGDARYTMALPQPVTLSTGIDVLSHCAESWFNRKAERVHPGRARDLRDRNLLSAQRRLLSDGALRDPARLCQRKVPPGAAVAGAGKGAGIRRALLPRAGPQRRCPAAAGFRLPAETGGPNDAG